MDQSGLSAASRRSAGLGLKEMQITSRLTGGTHVWHRLAQKASRREADNMFPRRRTLPKAGRGEGSEMQLLVKRDSPLLQMYPGPRAIPSAAAGRVRGSLTRRIIVTVPLKLRLHWSCQALAGRSPTPSGASVSAGCCPLTHSR